MSKRHKFPSAIGLARNDRGEPVRTLQGYLKQFGYLGLADSPNGSNGRLVASMGVFDSATVHALASYQRFHRLPITGKLDQATVTQMSMPRCGVPDHGVGASDYATQGNRWNNNNLTYRFVNFSSDLTQQEVRDAIAFALGLWSEVTPLTFSETSGASDIEIRFVAGDHGDGFPFDGTNGTLAHAFYPPPNGGDIAGDAHFDEAETWSVTLPASGIDLATVAAHEFGHSLGLLHSDVPGSLMFPTYGGPHRFLSGDDVSGVQSIYGPRLVERGDCLHTAGVTHDGHLWHTIRVPDGAWFPFGDVEGQTGDRGVIVDVDVHGIGRELHLCAIDASGGIWHTIRHANGAWEPLGDVEGQTGDRGTFRRTGIAEVNGELHVCGVTADGHVWHAIRRQNGTWTPFGDVEGQTGDRGEFVDVDCSGVGGELHVCGASSDGRLWHAIRHGNGTWTEFGDVEGQTGDRGTITEVACSGVNGELHVCAVSSDGHFWHSIRRSNGTWTEFGDVEGQTGDRGSFVRVSMGQVGGELHVAGATDDGRLWHAIRHGNGTWTALGDIEGQAGDRGSFMTVSVDGIFVP